MPDEEDRLALIADVAASYLRQNAVGVHQIANVVANVSKALDVAAKELAGERATASAPISEKPVPAIPVKRSVHREYIICLEDGVRVRTLKRHLMSEHGLTPAQYRKKWSLSRDYPSRHRSTASGARQWLRLSAFGKTAAKRARKAGRKKAA